MKDQMLALLRRGWTEFRAFTPGQKIVAGVAALAVVVAGVIFFTYRSTPQYSPLYTNLAPSDASAIVDKLNSAGVPYRLGQAGTEILVPQDKVYSTRLTVSSAGLPASSQTGYSLLDKEGVTTSEFKQQIDYQRAIEGELAKTIQSMSGVQSASVHLAIPQQDVFNDGSQKPTAAVMLNTSTGTQLTSAQVQSVVYLVSSSVPNLSSDSVTVTDSDGQLLASPGNGVAGSAGTDQQTQATQDYNTRMAAQLESLIAPVVGAGHAVVTVNANLDFSKTSTTNKKYLYDPKAPPLSQQMTKEKYNGAAAGSGGTLGAGTPATTGSGAAAGGSYTKSSDTKDNALGTQTQTIVNAPGAVNKMSVAVLLDSSIKGIKLAQVKSLLSSAAAIVPARGDSLSIQAMPFDTSATKAAAKASAAATAAASAKASHERLMSMVKQGVLLAIVLAVVIGTWLASRRRRRPAEDPPTPLDDFFEEPAPAASPQPDPAHLAAMADAREAATRRRALVALAEEQPHDVASVLSGWLSGREGDHLNEHRGSWNPAMTNANRSTP